MDKVTLKKIHVPGVGWFVIMGVLLYAVPHILPLIWPTIPPSAVQLAFLLCGIIARSIDTGVRPEDTAKLMQIIQQQEQEINHLTAKRQGLPPPPVSVIDPNKPVMRGIKQTATIKQEQDGVAVYAPVVIEAPSRTTRWWWG